MFYQKIKKRVSSRLLVKIRVSQVFWEPIKNPCISKVRTPWGRVSQGLAVLYFSHFLVYVRSYRWSSMGIVFSTNIQNNKKRFLSQYLYLFFGIICRIIAISNTSHLEAHSGIYRLLMKGILDVFLTKSLFSN